MRFSAAICGLSGLTLLAPSLAMADFFLHPWQDFRESHRSLTVLPEFRYYSTSSNFDGVGRSFIPTGFERYSRIDSDVRVSLGLNPYLTVFGRASWSRLQLDHGTAPGDSFGFTDQTVGGAVRVFESKARATRGLGIDLQAQVDFPLYDNGSSLADGTVFLGDGSIDITGGAFVSWPFSVSKSGTWSATGGVGFTKRTAGFSSAIPWSVSLRRSPAEDGFRFAVGSYGFQSLKTDQTSHIVSSAGSVGAGGSFIVNAINPSLINLTAEAGYQITGGIGAIVSGTYSAWGQAAPVGWSLAFGFQARWFERPPRNPALQAPEDYGKPNRGFVNYAFEGRVTRINDRMNLVRIDKGSQDGVELDQVFDIFAVQKDGSVGEAIARAKCTSVKLNEAVLTISDFFKEVWIEEGFLVKRPLQ